MRALYSVQEDRIWFIVLRVVGYSATVYHECCGVVGGQIGGVIPLVSVKLWRPFGQKCPPTFLKILRVEGEYSKPLLFSREAFEAGVVHDNLHDFFVHTMHDRCQGGDFVGHGVGERVDLGQRHDVVDQPNPVGFLCRQ